MRPANKHGSMFAQSYRMSAAKEGVETWRRKALDAICSWQFKHGRQLLLDNDGVPARFEKAGR